MKILIVYASVYGNTEQVAQAMGAALEPENVVGLIRAGSVKANHLEGSNLLIVGSPTQKFRPLEAINNFLGGIPAGTLKGLPVAAFDTRLSLTDIESGIERFAVKNGGYAANSIGKRVIKSGGKMILPPEGFLVRGNEGPLLEGELERAADWARQILGILG